MKVTKKKLLLVGCGMAFVLALLWTAHRNPNPLPPEARADHVLIEKSTRRLVLFRGSTVLKTYKVALGRVPLGPKQREGDMETKLETKELLVGALVTVFVFGAYFLGALHGQRASIKWREFFATLTKPLTRRGFLWATVFPAGLCVLFYLFVLHARLSLGQWPRFGQQLDGWVFGFYDQTVRLVGWALVSSLYFVPLILIGCLFFRRWRHVSVYAAAYGAAVGVAFGAIFLAPQPFLNWFLD